MTVCGLDCEIGNVFWDKHNILRCILFTRHKRQLNTLKRNLAYGYSYSHTCTSRMQRRREYSSHRSCRTRHKRPSHAKQTQSKAHIEPTAATDGHARTEANEKRKLSAAAANPQFHNLRCERQRVEGKRGNGNVDGRERLTLSQLSHTSTYKTR